MKLPPPIIQKNSSNIAAQKGKKMKTTEAHKWSSQAAMGYIAASKNSPIDWKVELERQKYNSQDH